MQLRDEISKQISDAENKNRVLDNLQCEYRYLLAEMLYRAMNDEGCAEILKTAHQAMQDKLTADNFLKSL